MVQPPSKQLQQILLGKKLCTARDLKRCVRRVRRLSADLPAFDSVWLDALVQSRRLTSFQAQTIDSGLTSLLTIGPAIALDRIGSGPSATTYLVRLPDTQLPAIIKRVSVATELKPAILTRLRDTVQKARTVSHTGVIVPHACQEISSPTTGSASRSVPAKGVAPARRRRGTVSHELTSELAVASRLVEGLTLSQMLLRRGRIPPDVVQEIARQLLEALEALEAAGIVHGEILSDNVRVDSKGRAVLVDAGFRPALQPAFSFTAAIDPRRYSGIAPELIGTAHPYSPASDLYALGCLLWELLTARAVFPTGDPLARLAAHQTTRIPDVREIAPDTPDALAETILWLTEPNPRHRPDSATRLLGKTTSVSRASERAIDSSGPAPRPTLLRPAKPPDSGPDSGSRRTGSPMAARSSRRSLSRYSAGFRSRPHSRSTPSTGRTRFSAFVAVAGLTVLLASAALMGLDGQSRNWVTATIGMSASIASGQPSTADHGTTVLKTTAPDTGAPSVLKPLPRPDAYGTITLADTGPWRAEPILWSGQRLTLQGPDEVAALLVVDRPVRFRASEIAFEGVDIVHAQQTDALTSPRGGTSAPQEPAAARPDSPQLRLESSYLSISRCTVRTTSDSDEITSSGIRPVTASAAEPPMPPVTETTTAEARNPFAFIWMPSSPLDSLPGEIHLQNVSLTGSRCSLGLAGSRHVVECRNVLQSGPAPLFVIPQSRSEGQHEFRLQHCTLRESGGLLEIRLTDGTGWNSRVHIRPVRCVFDIASDPSGDSGSLIRFRADALTPTWNETLSIDGSDSIARPDMNLVEGVSPDGRYRQVLDASSITLNGLIGATFDFQSPVIGPDFANSLLGRHDASLASSISPGIISQSPEASEQALGPTGRRPEFQDTPRPASEELR